ncbi:Gfo/Idh/MocA family protein [Formosa sp. A9]|uniref:Gfo/Idh/MocA family protein n=1 Tax=Formosa sp. A9 TaxID=3442641 RepID=UPI003EBED471
MKNQEDTVATKVLRFGIIGTGSIAATHVKAINSIGNAQVVAMAASNESRAKAAQSIYNVPVFAKYTELLDQTPLDVVCICTQSGEHLEPTMAAAERGIHVLCEKPLETTVAKASQMIQVCKAKGVKLGCIFQNRWNSDFLKVLQAVKSKTLGKLLMGNASINWYRPTSYYSNSPWRGTLQGDGGAALINQGIHTIDLLLCLMGNVKSVYGNVKTLVHPIEGEDVASAIVNFKSGAIGTITGGTALYPGRPERLEVYGEKGSIVLEGGSIVSWQIEDAPTDAPVETSESASGASDPSAIGFELHKLQIEDMIDAILSGREPLVSGDEALRALQLICSIYESSLLKKEISLL